MTPAQERSPLAAVRLAVNLLYLMVWSFAAAGKLREGMPPWFADKFGGTMLRTFPGLSVAFWTVTLGEAAAAALALAALVRLECLGRRAGTCLQATLVGSLYLFLMLGFGLWLTADFNGGFQHFVYFACTLVALRAVDFRR